MRAGVEQLQCGNTTKARHMEAEPQPQKEAGSQLAAVAGRARKRIPQQKLSKQATTHGSTGGQAREGREWNAPEQWRPPPYSSTDKCGPEETGIRADELRPMRENSSNETGGNPGGETGGMKKCKRANRPPDKEKTSVDGNGDEELDPNAL